MSAVPAPVVDLLRASSSVLLLAHLNPDGDVLGSQLALGLALDEGGRRVSLACAHPVPEPFQFLPGAGRIQQWREGRGGHDVVVTLDCPSERRLGGLLAGCRQSGVCVLNIDHHGDNQAYGDVNWINPRACATGEMVHDLILASGLRLSPEAATCLYTAIVTDTGSFRYSNTTARTFRLGAELVELGADPAAVAVQLYETRHLAGLHLLGRILQQVETNADGSVAFVVIDRSQTESPDLLEAEDFITYPRSLRDAKVAVLFRELPDVVKVSLRAKGEVDVARIAAAFGGGGHPNAAGAVVAAGLERAKADVLGAVEEALAIRARR